MEVKISELKEYNLNKDLFDNLSKEDYSALKEDIIKNGIKTELHITKSFTILCGNQRFRIAKEIGLINVPAKIVDVDENDELKVKEYVILDNVLRRHLTTEQKYLLIAELSKIYEIGAGRRTDLKPKDNLPSGQNVLVRTAKVTGMNEKTVQRAREYSRLIKEKPELKKEKVSIVLAKSKKDKHINKIKEEVKSIKNIELNLFEGDCLEQLKHIENNSIACLIIDPPYGIDFQSNHKLAKHDKIKNDKQEAFKLLDDSLKLAKSKMVENSHIYIFTHWKVFEFVKPIIEKYFEVKNTLIWNKNNWSMGDLQGNYAEKYEMIIFATQGNRNLLGDKRPINVLDFARTTNSNHPTEKPIDLLKELIKNSTVEGEIVLDYFAGSGSTLIASKELNRKFIGIEVDKNYINVIKSRLNKNE